MFLKLTMNKTSASAGLQDANPTIRPDATGAANSHCPPSHGDLYMAHLGSNAAAVTPRKPKSTKWEKTCPIVVEEAREVSRRYIFFAAEKSVTVQTKKQTKDKQKTNKKTNKK